MQSRAQVVDGLGIPLEFLLSVGNDHDTVHAVELLERMEICGSHVLADWFFGLRVRMEIDFPDRVENNIHCMRPRSIQLF